MALSATDAIPVARSYVVGFRYSFTEEGSELVRVSSESPISPADALRLAERRLRERLAEFLTPQARPQILDTYVERGLDLGLSAED